MDNDNFDRPAAANAALKTLTDAEESVHARLTDLTARRKTVEDAVTMLQLWYADPTNIDILAEFQPGDPIFSEIASNSWKLEPAGKVTSIYLEPAYPRLYVRSVEPTICYAFDRAPGYRYGDNTHSSNGCSRYFGVDEYNSKIRSEIDSLQRKLNVNVKG